MIAPDYGSAPAQPVAVKELQTRFLYPFFFDRQCVKEATEALLNESVGLNLGTLDSVWLRPDQRYHLYEDELLQHVADFLFGDPALAGCGYLVISDLANNAWFGNIEVELATGKRIGVRLVAGIRIEIFLSPQGIGVLSLALAPEQDELSLDEVTNFNYLLGQFRRRQVAVLRKKHPQDDPNTWERIPAEKRSQIPAVPAAEAPLAERLGAPGGAFNLNEFIEQLLSPLKQFNFGADRDEPSEYQKELCVYTVARFGSEADFADPAVRDSLAMFLAALAQVEEPGHAGALPGTVNVPNEVLNRRHWAAAGLLGSAHLVSDQTAPETEIRVAFDEQRLPVVRDKYFIPYLIAMLQRLSLNRAIDAAADYVAGNTEQDTGQLARLRQHLNTFGVRGHFTQISSRHALHRFYLISREGLDVPTAWNEVRRAVADIDAQVIGQREMSAERERTELQQQQHRLNQNMHENLTEIRRVQQFVHVLEYVLISVYCAHLWHMFAHGNHGLCAAVLGGHPSEEAQHWFVSVGVVVSALMGLGIAFVFDRFLLKWLHRLQHRS